MKKINYLILSIMLVCLMHITAHAQAVMPTWSYTFNHTLTEFDTNAALDTNAKNTSLHPWQPTTGDTGKFYFDYILTEFNFRNLDTDKAILSSNLTMSAAGYEDMNFMLNFTIEQTGYGNEYRLTVDAGSSSLTDTFIFDNKKYEITLGLYDILVDKESSNEYKEFQDGKVIIADIDTYDHFELDYQLAVTNVTNISPAPIPNPEPATLLLTGLGLAAIGFIRSRKKNM